MKTIFVLLVAAGLYFGWQKYYQTPPVLTPVATAPPHRVAPADVFFLCDYVSIPTKHGVTGWTPGERVMLDPSAPAVAGKVVVTDGTLSAALDPMLLTHDMDDAAALRTGDQQTQVAMQAQIGQAKAEHAQQLLAVQIETAKNVQMASVQNAAGSAMGTTSNRLQEASSYSGSAGGGSYYPEVVYYGATGSHAGGSPSAAGAPVPLSRPASIGAAPASAIMRMPAVVRPTMSSMPTHPAINPALPPAVGSVTQ